MAVQCGLGRPLQTIPVIIGHVIKLGMNCHPLPLIECMLNCKNTKWKQSERRSVQRGFAFIISGREG